MEERPGQAFGRRIVAIVTVMTAAACGQASPASTTPDEGIVGLLEEARRAGADPAQIAALEDVEVTFAEYESAMLRAFECIRASGIEVVELGIDDGEGFPLIDYAIAATAPGLSEDEVLDEADGCMTRFSRYVDMAWQVYSTEATEANEARWQRVREPLLRCLANAGEQLPSDASRTDMLASATRVLEAGGVDCLSEVDFFG